MANSFPQTPSGIHSPSYSTAAPSIARRSSYASVVSGTALSSLPLPQSSRAPPLFAHAATSTTPARSSPSQTISHTQTQRHVAESPPSIGTGSNRRQDSWERSFQQYRSPFQFMANYGAGSASDTRSQHFFIPSYLRGSRFMERQEEKHRAFAHREPRATRSSTVGSLSSSASSMNIHKMIPAHRGMAFDVQEKQFPHPEDITYHLPSFWSATDKFSGVEVLSDGSEIKYNGISKTQDEAAAIRSDHFIPKQCGIYYFEVAILSKNKECQIGIGLSGPKVTLSRQPGWETDSWAYHGDDGYSFNQTALGKSYGPKYGGNDVIGCGINFVTNSMFYTKNGVHLGTAFREVKSEALHPSVGMKKPGEHVRTNFGQQPFVFDIDGLVAREKESIQDQIERESFAQLGRTREASSLMPQLIAQYLAHEGYVDTAKVFVDEAQAAKTLVCPHDAPIQSFEFKEDLDAINRQLIRAAVLEGDIDKALKHTRAYYPSVLQENENIYFKLRCRKFVEMIRRCTLLQPRSKRPSMQGPGRPATIENHEKLSPDDYGDVFEGRMELDEDNSSIDLAQADQNDANLTNPGDNVTKQNELMAEALQYGQELRAEFKDDFRRETKKELEATFALIAYPDARDSSLAPLLEASGRVQVAEELSSAILVSLGKSSNAAIERVVQQAEVLISDLSHDGRPAALINLRKDYLS